MENNTYNLSYKPDDLLFKEETEQIIGAFYKVYRTMGFGFLEKVYQNALYFELLKRGFKNCVIQYPIKVYYEENIVGEYVADILVDNKILLELKACSEICTVHEKQLLNYLKATTIEVGLLLNFGDRPLFKRKVYRNDRK